MRYNFSFICVGRELLCRVSTKDKHSDRLDDMFQWCKINTKFLKWNDFFLCWAENKNKKI